MSTDGHEELILGLSKELSDEDIAQTLDYSFLNQGPYKFGLQESELNTITTRIKSNTLQLEDEARIILDLDHKTESISASLTEVRTKMAVNFGKALIIHRKHFRDKTKNSRNQSWIKWVKEKIPTLNKDRRWIHETLGKHGELFTTFYFLGTTELAHLIQACKNTVGSKKFNKDKLKYSFDYLGLSFQQVNTERDRQQFKQNLDKMISCLKVETTFSKIDNHRNLILDCIDSGVVFDAKVISKLNKMNSDSELDNFLREIRISGSVPNIQANRKDTRESLDSLLARLCDTIDIYIDEERLSTFDKDLAQMALKNINNVLIMKEIKNV
ncbi:MAG: hypothetical protein ACOCXT_06280 [Candidatus Dojkabacteria bacterium]